jgi:DNA-binding transcriptional regulator YiaG
MPTDDAAGTMTGVPRKKRDAAMDPGAFRQLLVDAGLTTREAARLLGVGNGTISQWQTGNTPIGKSAAKLIKLLIKPKRKKK